MWPSTPTIGKHANFGECGAFGWGLESYATRTVPTVGQRCTGKTLCEKLRRAFFVHLLLLSTVSCFVKDRISATLGHSRPLFACSID